MSTQDTPDTSDKPSRTALYTPDDKRVVIAPQRTDVVEALDTKAWVSAKHEDTMEVRQ